MSGIPAESAAGPGGDLGDSGGDRSQLRKSAAGVPGAVIDLQDVFSLYSML